MNATNENESDEPIDDLRSFLAYLKQNPEVKRQIEAEFTKGLPLSVIIVDEAF